MRKRSVKNQSLMDADIPGLRRRVLTGQSSVKEEADRFEVGIETIRRAVRGETFRHVKDFLPDQASLEPVEHATRNPVPPPEDLLSEIEESLQRVQETQAKDAKATSTGSDAVDDFLRARGSMGLPPGKDEEGGGPKP